ncbi:hypothetical protein ARMGADRAFT_1086973 [Armillaria gallica]|uniref:F-box domain-containing protein n=1 Tax=Armillaria gallica TaxID=47427 RepID=A0A2H3CSA6_ARMGA|nr:hypothetical protein ARMGADRAFT_1086973 [Armillaria gallica]
MSKPGPTVAGPSTSKKSKRVEIVAESYGDNTLSDDEHSYTKLIPSGSQSHNINQDNVHDSPPVTGKESSGSGENINFTPPVTSMLTPKTKKKVRIVEDNNSRETLGSTMGASIGNSKSSSPLPSNESIPGGFYLGNVLKTLESGNGSGLPSNDPGDLSSDSSSSSSSSSSSDNESEHSNDDSRQQKKKKHHKKKKSSCHRSRSRSHEHSSPWEKPIPPSTYNGSDDPKKVARFIQESEQYLKMAKLADEDKVFHISRYLEGPARDFYDQSDLRQELSACYYDKEVNTWEEIVDMAEILDISHKKNGAKAHGDYEHNCRPGCEIRRQKNVVHVQMLIKYPSIADCDELAGTYEWEESSTSSDILTLPSSRLLFGFAHPSPVRSSGIQQIPFNHGLQPRRDEPKLCDEKHIEHSQVIGAVKESAHDEEKGEFFASSSELSLIRRPSRLGPSIEELVCAYWCSDPASPRLSPTTIIPTTPFPEEVLTAVLSFLPCTPVAALSLLSQKFLSAVRLCHTATLNLTPHNLHVMSHSGLCHIKFTLFGHAEAELLMWLDGQTNVVSLCFPFLLDDDDDTSPPTPLPVTPTRPHLLSAPTTPSQPFLFPMPPLSLLPPTPTPTQDTFTHTTNTLLPNLTTLQGPPHLAILLAPSRPLIDESITIYMPIYAGLRHMTTLESLPLSVCCLRVAFKSVGKCTEEKTLRSAVVVCPAIEELEIEGEGGEECWCSIVSHFKSLQVLVMHIPGTAQVRTVKEELDERFPLPKRARTRSTWSIISHSGHSMVISERACATRLPNMCPALQRVVPNGVQWCRPSPSFPCSRSSPCLPFDDLFVKKIDRDVVPPPPPTPRKVVPLTEQTFMKAGECFDLNDGDDDDFLFFKPSPSRE